MKLSALAALVISSALSSVNAHATFQYLWVNGVDQGLGPGSYIRGPPNNNPVRDLTSSAVTCNVNPAAVSKTINVKGGDVLSFEWAHESRSPSDQIIDPSHKGPVLVYIAPTQSNGQGPVWVKLFEENYVSGSWAVDKLIAARGLHSIILPDLAPGDYLIRPEILALHEADSLHSQDPNRGIQLFHACLQIKVTSSGSLTLPSGISLPGDYKDSSSGIQFNLYGGSQIFPSYKAPGGTVWEKAAGGAIGMSVSPKPPTTTPTTTTTTPVQTPTKSSTSTTLTTSKATTTSTTSKAATTSKATTTTTPTTPSPTGAVVQKWQQCGGFNYQGPKACAAPLVCHFWNDWYSQCLDA